MDKKRTGVIYGVNGPVIYLQGKSDFKMSEMVYVGEQRLVGEVIALDKERTTIQVYEETSGLRPGEIVEASGAPVSVTLAPGIRIIFLTELRDRWNVSLIRVVHLLPEVYRLIPWIEKRNGRLI